MGISIYQTISEYRYTSIYIIHYLYDIWIRMRSRWIKRKAKYRLVQYEWLDILLYLRFIVCFEMNDWEEGPLSVYFRYHKAALREIQNSNTSFRKYTHTHTTHAHANTILRLIRWFDREINVHIQNEHEILNLTAVYFIVIY